MSAIDLLEQRRRERCEALAQAVRRKRVVVYARQAAERATHAALAAEVKARRRALAEAARAAPLPSLPLLPD